MDTTSHITVKQPLSGPAMKAAGAFATGIFVCGYIGIHILILLPVTCGVLILLAVLHRQDKIASLLTLAVMFLSGISAYSLQREIDNPLHIPDYHLLPTVTVEGIVIGDTSFYEGSTRFVLRCRYLETGTRRSRVSGLLPCTLYSKTISIPEGSHVSVRGTIKRYRRPLAKNGIVKFSPYPNFTQRLVSQSNEPAPVIIERGESIFVGIRNEISDAIDRYPFGGHGDLLKTMTIGVRSNLPPSVKATFARSGVAHVLAVSGLHVGILAVAFNILLSLFRIPRKTRIIITVGFMFFYAGLCGFRPPVTRAVIMLTMVFGSLLFERPRNVENSIFIALIIILAFDPASLFGASLQLSFAAVWGITTFYSPIMNTVKRWHLPEYTYYFAGIFITSVIASIITAPITAAHFGSLPLYGIMVNLVAIPLVIVIVNVGITAIIAILMGSLAVPLAVLLSFFTGITLMILSGLTKFVSSLPYASIVTGDIPILAGVCFGIWLYVISRSGGREKFKKAILYIPLIVLLLHTWYSLLRNVHFGEKESSVIFFDVGQGDAALVRYGMSHHFLIDTGPRYKQYDTGTAIIVPGLKSIGIDHLDGIFLSHTDIDHSGGVESVINNIRTDHIFCRKSIADSLSALYGRKVYGICAGDSIAFDNGGILVLAPTADDYAAYTNKISGENNYSLLVRFDINGMRLLFTGDIEEDVQHLVTVWGPALKSEVMKVPHHGAAGLQENFVDKIQPELALISCGAQNRYGHPAETTLSTLEKYGCQIRRTDYDGTILVTFPSLQITSF